MPDDDHKYISSTSGKNSLRVPIMLILNAYFLKWFHVKNVLITLILRKDRVIYPKDIL